MSFWQLLLSHNGIEIPIIQRDYAQGRLGKEKIREKFLLNLRSALDSTKVLKLDFVYGEEKNKILYPLDGQQRLTTLWLLHWYIALRSGKLKEPAVANEMKKFSYETRISSREFCENLCKPDNFICFNGSNIVDYIMEQTWFYSVWQQDPTIQSMLRMLGGSKKKDLIDGIEKRFGDITDDCFLKYWNLLTERNIVVFYHLPLKEFDLSDELYVKMNARGKPLTNFENFKADLIKYMENQLNEDKKWESLLNEKDGIPIKFDTKWMEIFWKNQFQGHIDEIYFEFLNRIFLNYRFFDIKDEEDKRYRYFTSADNRIAYESLDEYKLNDKIEIELFEQLIKVLENYHDLEIDESTNALKYNSDWNPKFYFIPKYDEEKLINNKGDYARCITAINQKERVAFYAICKYFSEFPLVTGVTVSNDDSLKRWMRFVWNLISVQTTDGKDDIRNVTEVKNAIRLIDLIENTHDIYKSLCDMDASKYSGSLLEKQMSEEITKAQKIVNADGIIRKYDGKCKRIDGSDYQTWEDVIIEAEQYAFFKGSIRFLFRDENGNEDWENFDKKWENVQRYFERNGAREEYKRSALLLRSLLSRINVESNWFDNNDLFWKNALLNDFWARGVSSFLLQDEVGLNTSCPNWIRESELIEKLLCNDSCSLHVLFNWRRNSVLTKKYLRRITKDVEWHSIVVLDHKRNELLNDDKFEVAKDCFVENTKYLYDWDVYFKYGGCFFTWKILADKNIIYMMTRDYENYEKRISVEENLGNPYFSFEWAENVNFIERLDNLIAECRSQNNS